MNLYLHSRLLDKYPFIDKAIEWSAWLWSLRTGVAVKYAGIVESNVAIKNAVVVRDSVPGEYDFKNSAAFASKDDNGFYMIVFDKDKTFAEWAVRQLVTHEMGHTLGYFEHSDDRGDIMYPTVSPISFPVTTQDAEEVIKDLDWPQTTVPDLTSAVLLPDNDLYHPDILGHQALLDYAGVINGRMSWKVLKWEVNEETKGIS